MIACPFCGSGLNVRDGGPSPFVIAWFCKCSRSVARSQDGFHVNFYDDFHDGPEAIASYTVRRGGSPAAASLGLFGDGDWDVTESLRRPDRERFLAEAVSRAVCRKVVEI